MKTRSRLLLLVALFATWARVPPASAQRRRDSSSSEELRVTLPRPPAKKCPSNMKGRALPCGSMCSSNANCPGDEMCCKYGCCRECLLPVDVNPGYCPKSNPIATARCGAECTTDAKCGKSKKCCRWGCFSSCVDAEPAHPGVCPVRKVLRRSAPCRSTCKDDRNCPPRQKCCFTGCSLECIDLEKGLCELPKESGSCTLSLEYFYYNAATTVCDTFQYSGCKGNANRFYTKEECLHVCGKPAHPGSCPKREVLQTGAHCKNACGDDRDCPATQKCCFSGCGLQCMDPETDVCRLPMDKGSCKAYRPMYYYSPNTRTCEMFIYGGCGGNGNQFSTREECVWTCRYRDICKLPMDQGRCSSHKLAYFYNYANKTCQSFIYHGCDGNENRFRTLEHCRNTCLYPEVCNLPVDPGPCEAHIPMYYYSHDNKSCVSFIYGGCLGNLNRFYTVEECEDHCRNPDICVLPQETGPCFNYSAMYHYSPAEQICLLFPYGGCSGNANRFPTIEECLDTCSSKDICKLPVDPGLCLAYIPRFYYNPHNKTCEEFIYGGCGGNENRFETQTECIWKCRNPDICKLPKEAGPCNDAVLRYYFNPASKTCEIFVYGGCKGNENQFETLSECEHACKKPDICRLPMNTGEGDDSIAMYYYDHLRTVCYLVTFKGHKGNANRFATLVECEETCRNPDICKLPQKPGPCENHTQRFYYNSTSGLCTTFSYGNCRGNMNNFPTQEECQLTCKGPEKPGSCPPPDSSNCLVTCQKDCECPGGRKCCSNQCGQVCKDPMKAKPGSCPLPGPSAAACTSRESHCRHDSECPSFKKCCSNGCGHICRKPGL